MKHEYHVSISQLDYNTKSSSLQISIKLHDEDVELLMDQNIEGSSYLEKDINRKEVEEFLLKYINTSFQVIHKGEAVELSFIGKELEEDALWIYLESKEFSKLPKIEVKNTLFLEMFDDQSNMVHYSKDNQVLQSAVLNKMKRSHTFDLE